MRKIIIPLLLFSIGAKAQFHKYNLQVPFDTLTKSEMPGFAVAHKNVKLYYIKSKPSLKAEFEGNNNFLPFDKALAQGKVLEPFIF
jgi:hypothetical protein